MDNYDNYNPEIIYNIEEDEKSLSDENIARDRKSPKNRRNNSNSKKKNSEKNKTPKSEDSNIFLQIKNWATSSNIRIVAGIFLACLSVYFLISFFSYLSNCIADSSSIANHANGLAPGIQNKGGEGGARLSNYLINDSFGLGSFVIIFWLCAMTLKLLTGRPHFKSVDFTIKCLVALITVSLIIGLATIGMDSVVNWGGYHGRYVNEFIIHYLGWAGAFVLCIFMLALFVIICLRDLIKWIQKIYNKKKAERLERQKILEEERKKRELLEEMKLAELMETENKKADEAFSESDDMTINLENDTYILDELDDVNSETDGDEKSEAPAESDEQQSEDADKEADMPGEDRLKMVVNVNTIEESDTVSRGGKTMYPWEKPYKFPPISLLKERENKISIDAAEQIGNKERIRTTLLDFGIPIVSIEATVGPTVTLYEIVPEAGVKVSKIRNLVDDIARSLAAKGVRIIAPIPGKGTVGIEVANKEPQVVSMHSIIQSKKYQESKFRLPLALGTTINNEVYITDLAKMPHLLVAGATGQGKSVGLNAIIASLLYKKKPEELKFILVDPKMVEFSLYSKIESHYLAKLPDTEEAIITDLQYVIPTLLSLCVEMDNRYQLLKPAKARNIEEYNQKIKNRELNPADGHKFLPYIVVIVDEFADLIMTNGKEVEKPIARLAQKARAVGIHVILATQRPSTDVITGIIKANFPARIAFKVYSGVDSKTILDNTEAKQLIGNGDMLISNNSEIMRLQCAFIDTPEVDAICDYVSRQPYGGGALILPEPEVPGEGGADADGAASFGSKDPLLEDVARLIIRSSTASTSSIQRHFSIGYNRAAKIMDQLEAVGVVGPSHGGKPRAVLVDTMALESILNSI